MRRPRFGVQVQKEEFDKVFDSYSVEFIHLGTQFEMKIAAMRQNVRIMVFEVPTKSFRFELQISKSNPVKVRQQAVLLMKKMTNKPLYDVFKA